MRLLFSICLLLFIVSCGGDEEVLTPSEQLVRDVTRGASKTWHFSKVTMTNSGQPDVLDLTGQFNTDDDEFVFSLNPTVGESPVLLQWRQRFSINATASTVEKTLTESYGSPKNYQLMISDIAAGDLEDTDNQISLHVNSNEELTGTLMIDLESELSFTLVPKEDADFKQAPNSLTFVEAAKISGVGLTDAPGMTGSRLSQAVYFSHRTPNPADQVFEEVVIRYDIPGRRVESLRHAATDFVTKQMHVIGDELFVITGIYLNTYDLSIQGNLNAVAHGDNLSRFGSAVVDDDIYVVGGDLNNTDGDKIKKWNRLAQRFERVAVMPSAKYLADAEIVDNKLYVFGGKEELFQGPDNDIIYIYDFDFNTFEVLKLPFSVFRTFTARYDNLIYIGGQIVDTDSETDDLDIFFAAFNTENNKLNIIETSFNDDGWFSLHQLTIVGDQLFVVYGDGVNANEGVQELNLYVADLP